MKTTKEKFLEVVSKEENTSLEKTRKRVKNHEAIKREQLKILKSLDKIEKLSS